MNAIRSLSGQEKAVIAALLKGKPATRHLIESLNDLHVAEMSDGGMGSLSLIPKGVESTSRLFAQQLVLGEFTDSDGVPVSVALNVDSGENLCELDVWKVNFSPLLEWPDPADIRIVG
ncbi:MAG: hypothetical protein HY040_06275 [Planctomycetes bacterium]|nr:hypothetical protein [Planctomycetota bacterium]